MRSLTDILHPIPKCESALDAALRRGTLHAGRLRGLLCDDSVLLLSHALRATQLRAAHALLRLRRSVRARIRRAHARLRGALRLGLSLLALRALEVVLRVRVVGPAPAAARAAAARAAARRVIAVGARAREAPCLEGGREDDAAAAGEGAVDADGCVGHGVCRGAGRAVASGGRVQSSDERAETLDWQSVQRVLYYRTYARVVGSLEERREAVMLRCGLHASARLGGGGAASGVRQVRLSGACERGAANQKSQNIQLVYSRLLRPSRRSQQLLQSPFGLVVCRSVVLEAKRTSMQAEARARGNLDSDVARLDDAFHARSG